MHSQLPSRSRGRSAIGNQPNQWSRSTGIPPGKELKFAYQAPKDIIHDMSSDSRVWVELTMNSTGVPPPHTHLLNFESSNWESSDWGGGGGGGGGAWFEGNSTDPNDGFAYSKRYGCWWFIICSSPWWNDLTDCSIFIESIWSLRDWCKPRCDEILFEVRLTGGEYMWQLI